MATYENPAKIHGFANGNDQFLAAGLEMYTLTTGGAGKADMTNQYVLDAVIQTISTVCAPVLLGTPAAGTLIFAVDRKGLPVMNTGDGKSVIEKIIALGNTNVGITFNADGSAATFADFTTGCSMANGATVPSSPVGFGE